MMSWTSRSSVGMQLLKLQPEFQGIWSSPRHNCLNYVCSSSYHTLKLFDKPSSSRCHVSKFKHISLPFCDTTSNLVPSSTSSLLGSLPYWQTTRSFRKSSFHHNSFWEKNLDITNTNANDNLLTSNLSGVIANQVHYVHNNPRRRERSRRTFSSNGKSSEENKVDESKKKEEEAVAESDEKLSLGQRFKKAYKEHGKVLIVVHLATSAVWFGAFYAAAIGGVDIVPLLESWNFSEKMISPFRSGGLGSVALAYLMYKLATPARYTVTLGGTNFAIRKMKKDGLIQPVAKEDTLREMYKEGKENMKTRGGNTRGRLRNMRQRIQGRMRRTRRRHQSDQRDS